jgi:hypothetical protein
MRSKPALALAFLAVITAACGDNNVPSNVIETRVAKNVLAAGERVDARCEILDPFGEPAIDLVTGSPLSDVTEMIIDFRHPDSFGVDDEAQVIAIRAGEAQVRCSAPDLDLADEEPELLTITAGAPVRVLTQLDSDTSIAGEEVGVSCLVFDAFGNSIETFPQAISVSPFGAGTTATTDRVSATLVGEYEVTCVVQGAADVESDFLLVLPALPASIVGSLSPERTVYAIDEQVTLIATVSDEFGNRVDDVALIYGSSPAVPSPSEARFQFDADGPYTLTATVTSATKDNIPLSVSLPVFVNSSGPAITCRRFDAPSVDSEAYMVAVAPGSVSFPVNVTDAFTVSSVTIGGTTATFDAASGNFVAPVTMAFGMNFVDVVATDQFGKENSTTCFVLASQFYTPEANHMSGALGFRLDPNAIGDSSVAGAINSLNDILFTVLNSQQLKGLVNAGLVGANPINDGGSGCGLFNPTCEPDVNYANNTIDWNTPTTSLTLRPGGLTVRATLPNVRLTAIASRTCCCLDGSTVRVTASSVDATINFNLTLAGGVMRASLAGTPTVTVGSINLNSTGFCGFVIDLLQSVVSGLIRNEIRDALVSFINSDIAPLLDQLTSSLDVDTLGTTFDVQKLDGSGNVQLGFGLALTSVDITTGRALLGLGTRFTPGAIGQNRPSLGIPHRTASALLDVMGTNSTRPVGIAFYEGALNQVLHGLWRAGYFQASIALGDGQATIDARLPPVARIKNSSNQAQLMLGGIAATITIPGVIDDPIPILFGGRATASVSLTGDTLAFGGFALDQLFVSFQTPLTQNQRTAMADFLALVLNDVLADAINGGLPAFPIPTFALPASAAEFGLPAGAELGILNPLLTTPAIPGTHLVLTGGFGVRP